MKILYSSNRNPYFETFTEYIEKAFIENGCQVNFFENRDFLIPGRIRDRFGFFHKLDLKMLNKKLLSIASKYKPDIFLESGGWNILPEAIEDMRQMGITTALWTIDPPRIFDSIIKAAPHYDFVFTQGSEASEILQNYNIRNLHWLPFACDPDYHKPVNLTDNEKRQYSCDICFVGSGWPSLYPERIELLTNLSDYNLGIWGPGWNKIDNKSPLRKYIRAGFTKPEEWTKIFSASKIIFHSHFRDPKGVVPCYQASPRVFEALSCGGFLVVDEQRDVLRLFVNGEDLVVFKNINDLKRIIEYYLINDDKARSIARNGKEKVLKNHTFKHRVNTMLTIINLALV